MPDYTKDACSAPSRWRGCCAIKLDSACTLCCSEVQTGTVTDVPTCPELSDTLVIESGTARARRRDIRDIGIDSLVAKGDNNPSS